MLEPKGFTVHSVRRQYLTAADLNSYQLVILIRSGNLPLNPMEILGLRSYVATGGSLLVVVSPAYEAAASGLHNGLLEMFDARADHDSVDQAASTRIVGHPITRDISTVTARHAVALNVPAEASLIESTGKTILAAMKYRHGRVVISSFGQWLLPDPRVFGDRWQKDLQRRRVSHDTQLLSVSKLPLEQYEGTNQELIENVIEWLVQPRSAEVVTYREKFADACFAAQTFEARAMPQDQLMQHMDKLVEQTEPGLWKEESLWLATEALLRKQYITDKDQLSSPQYGYPRENYELKELVPQPKYFKRLIDRFPASPLRPYAQWRLGDCNEQVAYFRSGLSSRKTGTQQSAQFLALYEKIDTAKGSHIWAWKHLRIGNAHLAQSDFENAFPHFREVSEQMIQGPEKSIALLNLGQCFAKLGRKEEAKKCYRSVMSLPNIVWSGGQGFEDWAPRGAYLNYGNQRHATNGLEQLSRK